MATAVIMPRQGQSVESCVMAKWHKQKGDAVSAGDMLFTYETDKATFDETAKVSGVLLDVFFEEGGDVPCLTNVCVIGLAGEDASAFVPPGSKPSSAVLDAAGVAEGPPGVDSVDAGGFGDSAAPSAPGGPVRISPRARLYAQKIGADVSYAVPTGANGRVMERDIQRAAEAGRVATGAAKAAYVQGSDIAGTGIGGRIRVEDIARAESLPAGAGTRAGGAMETETRAAAGAGAAAFEDVKLTNTRRIIAGSMRASLMNAAQLTLNASFDASDIMELRRKLKGADPDAGLPNVSVTDIIVFAAARVLLKHRYMNSHFIEDEAGGGFIRLFGAVNMGVAVDTPKGLMVPTVFGADKLTLAQVSAAIKELAGQCRGGAINPDLLKDGTFTVSNLGAFGVESFTPVLNPPQTGILGVCAATERTRDGKTYQAIGLSLTFDHRTLDGADAARFLRDLARRLESFSLAAALGL